jgi:uncharacterized protein YcbX
MLAKNFSLNSSMSLLRLSEIWIYPIKSLGGVRLSSARIFEKGLQNDRRWMIIDENGIFLTQRVHHQMALFSQSIVGGDLIVRFGTDSITIPIGHSLIDVPVPSVIWDDQVTTFEVNKEFSKWFADRLGISCRLVAFPESSPRAVDERYKVNNEHVSLADAYPFLIIGRSSLEDLNSRLKEPVPMNRFRPNFVFTGGEAFGEDNWKNFTIGNNRFVGVKKCARCVLITVDQNTGEKGKEPLATLSKYRREGEKVVFGQNAIAIDHDEIYEGDTITLL